MALAENEIDDIYKNEKNIDSSLKVFQRSITKFLNQ
jgi:multiple sugar transport system substrate-binding protein